VLTSGWLIRMIEVAESDSKIGLVGPISNEVSGLQIEKEANYKSIEEMHIYTETIRNKNKSEIFHFPRIAFLCTLIKREVIDKIGGLDERFSPGNYEDDDYCLRAQLAGFKTVIAKDVFIHHYGSKSFKADGGNKYAELLEINKQKFIDKWGVTPDELWLQNKSIKPRQIVYPINTNLYIQYYERAKVNIADKEYHLAIESLKNAIEVYKSNGNSENGVEYSDLLDLAGNVSLLCNDLDSAKEYFEEELNTNPNSSSACIGLGECFFKNDKINEAKVMFEWGVKNNPENQIALTSLSKINRELGLNENHNSLN
jgi:tetratricopeptide (TPR) repeat protein